MQLSPRISARTILVGFAVVVLGGGSAVARPYYGNNCVDCHSSNGFGNTTTDAVFDLLSPSQATIPPGAFGDPDRGVGPLASYEATPGSFFTLSFNIKDPNLYTPAFNPTRWAIAIKDVHHTDPDYQLGNADPFTWRDDQLTLAGASDGPNFGGADPAPFPASAADWTRYTRFGTEVQYYGSTYYPGHEWTGPFQFDLPVTVPTGVLPGWYDIEVSSAGWDYSQGFAFYDEEHFYLHVVPEPAVCSLLLAGLLFLRRRRV